MNRLLLILSIAAAVLMPMRPVAQDRTDVALRAAMETETVKGDLKAAIDQYRRIAAETHDRAIAATALVRMAECYQKLGDAQARQAFEQVIRDYPEQSAAVQKARTDLSALDLSARTGAMVLRKVWSGAQVAPEGSVSWDGRYVTYPAWESGDLGLHDVVTGTDRLLTHNHYARNEYAQGSAISRDSRQVAFAWANGTDHYQVRLVVVTPDGSSEPRVVYDNADIVWLWPLDWSPDNTTVAVFLQHKDQTGQIGLLRVADGSMRILKSLDWRGTERLSFSPDGRYLGFDAVVEPETDQRDVFVIAVDGSRERRIVQHAGQDLMMGWSADGRTLLFGSDRSGTMGLWAVPMSDGAAAGAPVQIKAEIGPISLGTTRSNALFTMARIGTQDVRTAEVDLSAGRLVSAPESIVRGVVGVNRMPEWSPDGKYLAYASVRGISGRERLIVIRSLDDGRVRELQLPFPYAAQFRWTPDGRAFVLVSKDLKGRNGIFRVDAQTGAVTQLVALGPEEGQTFAEVSPDGSKLYYWRGRVLRGKPGSQFVERDLTTGAERVIFADRGPVFPSVSPDGQYLAGVDTEESAQLSTVVRIAIATGERRELFRTSPISSLSAYCSWTPDGQHVVVPIRQNGVYQGLMIPVSGGEPRHLAFEIGQLGARFHPNGREMAFSTGRVAAELWVLENFLPPTASSTR